MIVCDASFLIAILDQSDAHHPRAVQLAASHQEEPMAASAITTAEVLVAPGREERLQMLTDVLEIDTFGVGADAAVRLAELRARTSLKMPDCCVLQLAESVDGQVATMDRRLARTARDLGLAPLS